MARQDQPPRGKSGDQQDKALTYPMVVLRAGEPGMRLYDACIKELTTGAQPVSLEVAEFMVMQDWPQLVSYLPGGGGQDPHLTDTARGTLLSGHEQGYDAQPHVDHGHWGPGRSITVTYSSEATRSRLAEVVGHDLKPRELAGLTASPRGSSITVHGPYISSTRPDGSRFLVSLQESEHAGELVANLQFYRHGAGQDEASYRARDIQAMVHTAHAMGVHEISTKCRPFSDDHVRLAKLGFDCPIKEAIHESRYNTSHEGLTGYRAPTPPRSFLAARWLSEALGHADAAAWWQRYGLQPRMAFDPTPGSPSRQRLSAAVREERTHGS